jgi:uncharacterized protein YjbI with pentapeptide repeats
VRGRRAGSSPESPAERYARVRRGGRFGDANFESAKFTGVARFGPTEFAGNAWFGNATFTGNALFEKARFTGDAIFINATFTGDAVFKEAEFESDACFVKAIFVGEPMFDDAFAHYGLRFVGGQFESASHLGPVLCTELDLSRSVFRKPVTIEAGARWVVCERTRWQSAATLRLRYAGVSLTDAVVTQPVAVTHHPTPLGDESRVTGNPSVQLMSLRGVDAAHLVFTDIDLADCLFIGAFHLDQVRIEGNCVFRPPPVGLRWRGIWPERWSRRRTLAEEHHWRAMPTTSRKPHPGWAGRRDDVPDWVVERQPVGQGNHATTERFWRNAFGSAEKELASHYEELEMRRRKSNRPLGLLWLYWVLTYPGLQTLRTFDYWRATRRQPAIPRGKPQPGDVAAIYRSLRKALEDAKNEPDAADFYYGEMEMRRHDPIRSLGERRLLWLYWLLSGYGLRVTRALGWLAIVMALTVLGLMFWGLPADPHPRVQPITGTLATGSAVDLATRTPLVSGAAPGPWSEKVSKQRLDRALRVATNSVAFRSGGQGLTRAGTYIEMWSRLTAPILLVLIIIAVRGRVKR